MTPPPLIGRSGGMRNEAALPRSKRTPRTPTRSGSCSTTPVTAASVCHARFDALHANLRVTLGMLLLPSAALVLTGRVFAKTDTYRDTNARWLGWRPTYCL